MNKFLMSITLLLISTASYAAYIPNITEGLGIIIAHGGGMSFPGCTQNYDPIAGDAAQEIQEGAKSITYDVIRVGLFNRCFNVNVESSAPIPYVNLDAMVLKYPPTQTSTHIITTATELIPQPFTISEVKNVYGVSVTMLSMGQPNTVTQFKCAIRPVDKSRIEQLGFIGKSLPVGFVMKMSYTHLGSESTEPYNRCVNYSYTLDPDLFATTVTPPPIQCKVGCVPAP